MLPCPGMDLLDLIVHFVKQNKGTKKRGQESAWARPFPPRQHGVSLCDGIRIFEKNPAGRHVVNAVNVAWIEACYIKEPGEIKLLRQAAAIADSGIKDARDALDVGMMETEIAGIGEKWN